MTRDEAKARGITVKPLAWEDRYAETPFGCYVISEDTDDKFFWRRSDYPIHEDGDDRFDDISDTKAAAQADYEARILEALL